MTVQQTAFLILLLTGTAALAHQGVKNAAVLARMDGMKAMKEHLDVIGETTKGKRPFDQNAISRALKGLDHESHRAIDLFRAPEQDPKSESLPAIWQDYGDFTNRLQKQADLARARPTSPAGLRPLLVDLGTSCKSCHDQYRK
ncbi:MAG: cytochrome c [Pelagimonas sp.]|jgi:cytochrome c556|nr:cytochrome c [Pelagimonas sp.]